MPQQIIGVRSDKKCSVSSADFVYSRIICHKFGVEAFACAPVEQLSPAESSLAIKNLTASPPGLCLILPYVSILDDELFSLVTMANFRSIIGCAEPLTLSNLTFNAFHGYE